MKSTYKAQTRAILFAVKEARRELMDAQRVEDDEWLRDVEGRIEALLDASEVVKRLGDLVEFITEETK